MELKMKPKIGNKIYIPTRMYVDRGEDDIQGGLAEISKVHINKNLPENSDNKLFVSFVGIHGRQFNYKSLMRDQEKLSKRYKDQIAKPDPDYGGNTGGQWE